MDTHSDFNGVVFRLGGALFALEAIRVREVLGGADLQPLYVSGQSQGFLQSRGRTMTVLDLRSVFSLPPVEREGPNAFIAVPSGEPGKLTALWVDSVVEMVTVPFAEMKPLTSPVAGIPEGILASMFIRGEEAIFLLNLERVLSGPGKSGEEAPALNSLAV